MELLNIKISPHELIAETSLVDNEIENIDYIESVCIDIETLSKYDYILLNNESFYIDDVLISNAIDLLEKERIEFVQFTLSEINDFRNLKSYQYREMFSPLLIKADIITKISNVKKVNLHNLFITLRYSNFDRATLFTNYIGEKINTLSFYNKLIYMTANIMDLVELEEVRKIYINDHEFIHMINRVINNRVFESNITSEIQINFLKLLKEWTIDYKNITEIKHNKLYLVYRFVEKELYEIAVKVLFLYRSKTYWIDKSNKMILTYGKDITDVRQSDSWIKTQKLRNIRLNFNNFFKYKVEKMYLKVFVGLKSIFKKKESWLLAERLDSANDNAFHLFKYIIENSKDVEAYYLVNKNAVGDLPQLEQYKKNIILFGSLKHRKKLLESHKLITAFTIEENILPYNPLLYKDIYKKELDNKVKISIQHGMIFNNISPYMSPQNYLLDYITASNKLEKQIIVKSLGFNPNQVLVSSMPRLDNLNEKVNSNQILFMPTWQRSIMNYNYNQFSRSEYYKKIVELLTDNALISFLNKQNLTLKFLLHPKFSEFSDLFNIVKNERIILSNVLDENLSDCIRDSKLLITDYSSISIDFLYQEKNVIFYQYNQLAHHHVPTKEITYDKIGYIKHNKNDILSLLENLAKVNFVLSEDFKQNKRELFSTTNNHAKTVFNEIKKLKK